MLRSREISVGPSLAKLTSMDSITRRTTSTSVPVVAPSQSTRSSQTAVPVASVGDTSSSSWQPVDTRGQSTTIASAAGEKKQGGMWSGVLDNLQKALDVGGLIPGVGEFADALNVGVSALRGDYVGAALSAVSMIPIAGDAIGKGAKALLAASNTPAAKQAAKKLFELVGKTDFASFTKNLKATMEKIPQIGKKAGEAMDRINQGLDQVLSTIANKFGLPKPVLAMASEGGTPQLNRPPARPQGTASTNAAADAAAKLRAKAVDSGVTAVGKVDVSGLAKLADQASYNVRTAVDKAFASNQHLYDHVVPQGADGAKKLSKEFTNRQNKYSAFPSESAAKDAATSVVDALEKQGISILNPRSKELQNLAKGDSITLKDGVTLMRDDKGVVSAQLVLKKGSTGVNLKLDGNTVKSQQTNAIKLVMNPSGTGFTTVFPLVG
jgi:flagellar hook-basal body complex protein FliE